jgi:hypothetical protein
MKMKEKTKNKKVTVRGNSKEKNYPAYYLALVLAGVLILEGLLLGAATPRAWQHGLEILDISQGVELVANDSYWAIEPMLVQMDSIQEFYDLAATEMMVLLDASESDVLSFPKAVNEFYRLASIEMEKVLDLSENISYWPRVAGTSISK